ncbi:hypothetical protein [Nocardioides zeae]|uniref:hypothetical protein n=1 Tax=Nocardioides zeae TaxID=1457234 RepID=UPI0027D8FBCC|nr:hypothetical protein [Nocardioides zeae]
MTVLVAVAGILAVVLRGEERGPSETVIAALADDPAGVWWPTEIDEASAPGEVDRVRDLLSESRWSAADLDRLAAGLTSTTAAVPGDGGWADDRRRARVLLLAVSSVDSPIDPVLQAAALDFLEPWAGAMTAALSPFGQRPAPFDPAELDDPAARLVMTLWAADSRPLIRRELLVPALRNLGSDTAAADDFIRRYLAWMLPLAGTELSHMPEADDDDRVGANYGAQAEWNWFGPAAEMVAALAEERCRADRHVSIGSCVDGTAERVIGAAALRTTYEAVPVARLPHEVVVGDERVPWGELTADQEETVARWYRGGSYPGPRRF